jgi:hypothetical protein
MVEGNHSRLNLLHLAEIMMIALGLCTVIKTANRKWVITMISIVYMFQAGVFSVNLFTDLTGRRNITMRAGLEEGLKLAKEKINEGSSIGVTGGISYVQILFYDMTDPSLFRTSVVRQKEGKYREAEKFANFYFGERARKCQVVIGDFGTEINDEEYEEQEIEWIRVWWKK